MARYDELMDAADKRGHNVLIALSIRVPDNKKQSMWKHLIKAVQNDQPGPWGSSEDGQKIIIKALRMMDPQLIAVEGRL